MHQHHPLILVIVHYLLKKRSNLNPTMIHPMMNHLFVKVHPLKSNLKNKHPMMVIQQQHHQLNDVMYVNQILQPKLQQASDKQLMVHINNAHQQVLMKHRWLMEIVQVENEDDLDLVNHQL